MPVLSEAEGPRPNVAGIDLASAPEYGAKRYNRVGLAALAPDLALLCLEAGPFDDDRIAAFVVETKAEVVAIDAPLSLPAGRCCADESCRCARFGRVRAIDRACFALGLRPFPALIPSMRGLTLRGIALKARFESLPAGRRGLGLTVIEVFPGAVQDMLRLPRKQAGLRPSPGWPAPPRPARPRWPTPRRRPARRPHRRLHGPPLPPGPLLGHGCSRRDAPDLPGPPRTRPEIGRLAWAPALSVRYHIPACPPRSSTAALSPSRSALR